MDEVVERALSEDDARVYVGNAMQQAEDVRRQGMLAHWELYTTGTRDASEQADRAARAFYTDPQLSTTLEVCYDLVTDPQLTDHIDYLYARAKAYCKQDDAEDAMEAKAREAGSLQMTHRATYRGAPTTDLAMDKVLEAIKAEGVAEKDIQTSRFSVHQVSRWDREKEENVITGYEVSNMVNVKVREIDKAGAIIDATTAAGGDLTRINSMNFAIDDDRAYREQARELAIEEARAKAEQLAKLSRVKLGEATYVTETSFSPPIVYSGRLEMAAAAPPMDSKVTSIAPGELTVSVSVQIVYAIE